MDTNPYRVSQVKLQLPASFLSKVWRYKGYLTSELMDSYVRGTSPETGRLEVYFEELSNFLSFLPVLGSGRVKVEDDRIYVEADEAEVWYGSIENRTGVSKDLVKRFDSVSVSFYCGYVKPFSEVRDIKKFYILHQDLPVELPDGWEWDHGISRWTIYLDKKGNSIPNSDLSVSSVTIDN